MEVKIKTNNEVIDAIVEMVDGVMIVSPKEEKWLPKYGDKVYYPDFIVYTHEYVTPKYKFLTNTDEDKCLTEKGYLFRNEEECQAFCDKLTKAIIQVKQ